MTIKELKNFIKDCNDDDYVTICSCSNDNPASEYCDVDVALKINYSNDNVAQICLMPR